jgi:Domain of unknown function (DUF1992)
VSLERIAEEKIRDAIARGEFDNLPGAGKPIDLEEYFRTPEELRMAYSILKSARCLPEEVELMNEIAALDRELGETAVDSAAGAQLRRRLRDRRLQLAILVDRKRRRRR